MINKVLTDFEEWSKRNDLEMKEQNQLPIMRCTEKWLPPPENWLKCNVDGAWNKENEYYGIGLVLKDHYGNVCWIETRKLPRLRSPLEVKAEAMR